MSSIDLENIVLSARKIIEESYETDEGEFGSTLYVSHHLDELEPQYWVDYFGSNTPEPVKILKGLVVKPVAIEDELEGIDFTLPGEVTNYVLAVYLDENHQVEEISMES